MAPPVTEMAGLSIKPGAKLEDASTSEGKIFQEGLKILSSQPGYQRCYYGPQVEDGSKFRWFIDWDSRESHKIFEDSDVYPGFLKLLGPLLAGPPLLYHAVLDPFPPSQSCTAPATEVLVMYYPTTISTAEMDAHAENFQKIAKAFTNIEGCKGLSGGWTLEELSNEKIEGGKAKAYVALLGWTSVEAHMKGRESQVFKDNIHLISDAATMSDREMFHVHFNLY